MKNKKIKQAVCAVSVDVFLLHDQIMTGMWDDPYSLLHDQASVSSQCTDWVVEAVILKQWGNEVMVRGVALHF